MNLEEIELFGSANGDTLIDDLSVDPQNMLFPDADKDGLPNAWEIANGSNPNLYDRDNIKPGTNKSFLDHYMDSLWSSGLNGNAPLPPQGSIPPVTILGAHQPVTSLKGSMSVGGDGSMTYSMPIDIPKGTGGMEPKVSLNYSSAAGNGIAGVGWSLAGFQSITRGNATTAKDDFEGVVRFDGSDRFFFNGERLVCVTGTYGQQGSEYRTEIDSFARIYLMGGNQNDPASWWKVETKAGLIIELGNTSVSKVISPLAAAPITWDVNKVSDTVGNYYNVNWAGQLNHTENLITDRRVTSVDYTGNTNGLAPYCSIVFNYENRPDKSFAYHPSGLRYDTNQRLSNIEVKTGAYKNHTYFLNYETSHQSSRSLLKSAYKQQPDGSTTSPTVFNWEGLKAGQEKWMKVGSGTLPVYSGNSFDANLATINSTVTTNGTSVRLDGDVARYHTVPGNINVTTGSFIEFDFRAEDLENGAYLIVDNNITWNNSGEFCIRIKKPTGAPAAAIPPRRDLAYTVTPSNWQTFRVPFQGQTNTALNMANGAYSNLALINHDDVVSNGTGYAEFRNIRIGTAAQLDGNQVNAMTFPETFDIPRFTAANGVSRGTQIIDLNSDGLPDFIDQKVEGWQWSGNELVPNPANVSGKAYVNTGKGFVSDSGLLPSSRHALVNIGGGGDWITRFDLTGVPCDVNGDGNLDFFVTELKAGDPGATSTQRYKFMTFQNGAWTQMTNYHPKFVSKGSYPWGSGYAGIKHLKVKDLVDMNRDGYPDLIIETHSYGTVAPTNPAVSPTTLLPQLSSTVFLNLVHKNLGWVKSNSHAPPASLRRTNNVFSFDIGSRLIDIDGDGFLDMVSSTVENPTTSIFVDARKAWKFWPAQSSSGSGSWLAPGTTAPALDKNPWWFPAAPYLAINSYSSPNPTSVDGNAPVIAYPDSQSKESGTFILDINGDGLTDIVRSFSRKFATNKYERSHSAWFNKGSETSAKSSRWLRDSSAYGSGYTLPISLTTEALGDDQSCHQFTDLNGDGLTDILFSRDGTKMAGPNADRVTNSTDPFNGDNNGGFINNGTGWVQDKSWALPTGFRLGKAGTAAPAAVVADINGDGFPDVIGKILNGELPKLRLNQSKPEIITAITDGFGSELQVEYHRLNDPSPTPAFGSRVYEKFTGTLPVGQANIIDSRLVVSRYSEPNGMGGRNYKSQRYGDLRYDRNNETSLGFGWIEALDETNGQLTRTDNHRSFPFAGSPILTQTSVMLSAADIAAMPLNHPSCPAFTVGRKNLSIETATFAEMPSQAGVGGTIRRPVQTGSVKHIFDLDGTLKGETVTTQNLADFDSYGFVTQSTVSSLDGSSVVSNNQYNHIVNTQKWHLGRLSSASVTKTALGVAASTKSSAFTYDTATGLLKSETVEPGHPLSVTTAYTHDIFGNVTTTAVTASGLTRSASTVFDSSGRFVTAEVNQSGYTVTYQYDFNRALVLSTTDMNDLTTSFFYDSFGTLIRTAHPDSTETVEVTGFAANFSVPSSVWSLAANQNIAYFRAKQSSGTPIAKVYFDALGRELITVTTALKDGSAAASSRYRKVYTVTTYDSQGRKASVSDSFFAGEIPNFTVINYDLLSRVTKTIRPGNIFDGILEQGACMLNGQPTTYSKVQNTAGQILERWEDQHGRLAQSKDPSGQITIFNYDTEGRLLTVSVGGTILLTNTWDTFGKKIAVSEVNSGTSTSVYNGMGELVSSTNANGLTSSFTYDSLGRGLTVTKPEGTFTTTYSEVSGSLLGKVTQITGSGSASGYLESFTYDSLGRPLTASKTQFGETFTTSTLYDALGRVTSSTDAGGLTVMNEYDNAYSFPLQQKLAPGTYEGAGTVLWQAGTFDSKGHAITQTLAQGVTINSSFDPQKGDLLTLSSNRNGTAIQNKSYAWDNMGNLTSRTDNIAQRQETFGYDNLNRLTTSTVASLPGASISTIPPPQTYSYDIKGNLLSKGSSASLTYADNTRIHAVTSAVVKGFNRTYSYDSAGYVTSDSKRSFAWTSFGQLKQVLYEATPGLDDFSGGMVHPAGRVQSDFDFDAGGNRARQIKERTAANDSRKIENTLYLGSYEREVHTTKTDGAASPVLEKTVHRHSLGGGMIYSRVLGGSEPGTKLTNVLADHLGSTDAVVVGIWNGSSFSSQTTEYQSFDAWGERRDATTQVSYRSSDSDPFRTSAKDYDRGYTGHEQLDDSGLIHMNGRIYDPELGRFLSADPVVQIPEYSQNFNRYSYVLNNPLNATDPSGFSFLSKAFSKVGSFIKENWRTIAVIVVAAVLTLTPGGQAFIGAIAGALFPGAVAAGGLSGLAATGAVIGGITGGLNAGLNGGNLGDVLRGVAVGGISGAITGSILHGMEGGAEASGLFLDKAAHVAGHGIVGGASNVALGGKFQDGFLSAAAGAYAGWTVLKNTMIANSIGSNGYGRTFIAGAVGGTASVLGGGKFANGAYTAAFQHLLNAESRNARKNVLDGIGKGLNTLSRSPLGYIWSLPNTAIGLAWGGLGLVAELVTAPFKGWDFQVTFGNNAVQFEGHPFMRFGAITFGNTIHYPPSSFNFGPKVVGFHEIRHTYQGQILGPLYLPANIIGMGSSILSGKGTHNGNFMESFGASAPCPNIHKH